MLSRRAFVAGAAAGLVAGLEASAQVRRQPRRVALVDDREPVTSMIESGPIPWGPFLTEMRRLGYVENSSVAFGRWSAEGRVEAYARLAAEIVASGPEVIYTRGVTPLIAALLAATAKIPVIASTTTPIEKGFALSLGPVDKVIDDGIAA